MADMPVRPTEDTLEATPASTPAAPEDPKRQALETAHKHLRRMLFFRKQYDARRAAFYRQHVGIRDRQYFPDKTTPRSNTFVPYPVSNVETIYSRTDDAFFNYDPWFECRGRGEQDEAAAERMGQVLAYLLGKSNFHQAFETLVRNCLIYGHGAIKVDWDWDYDIVVDPQPEFVTQTVTDPTTGQTQEVPIPDPNTGQPIVRRINPIRRPVKRDCPRFIAIDVYDFVVDPDGGITGHLTERTLSQLKRELELNKDRYYPDAIKEIEDKLKDEPDKDSVIIRIAEIWNDYDKTCTILTAGEDAADVLAWKDLRYATRSANYSTWKRKAYQGPAILLWHGENQFPHKQNPILHTSYIKLPNEVYGLGAIEVISELTEGLNRFVNMIADNWNLGINRRYAYDVNADIDHAALNNFNVPGGKVGVSGDPTKVVFPLPTHTPEAGDFMILDLYKGMIEMASGISDFYAKGMGAPVGNRTATGINQVINESNYRFRLFIRNLELDVLQPLLAMCASMVQTYLSDEVEIRITDAAPGIEKWPIVKPEELIGNFDFELVAANYASNKIVRQRNILAWANWAMQSPYFDPYNGLIELGKIFEIRNIHKLLRDPRQVAQEQQAAKAEQIKMMLLEAMLGAESKARLQQTAPRRGKDGRPAKVQFEGKIPGAGLSSTIRDLAQNLMGANAAGLEGMEGADNG